MSIAVVEVTASPMSREDCANSSRGFLPDPAELQLSSRSATKGFALRITPEHREELLGQLKSLNSFAARHRDSLSLDRKKYLSNELCTAPAGASKQSMWMLYSDGCGQWMYEFRPLPEAAWYFDTDSHVLRIVGKFICPNGTDGHKMQLRIAMRDGSVAAYHAA